MTTLLTIYFYWFILKFFFILCLFFNATDMLHDVYVLSQDLFMLASVVLFAWTLYN